MVVRHARLIAALAAFAIGAGANQGLARAADLVTIDRLVGHVSTVPAAPGKPIDLFVREKVIGSLVEGNEGKARAGSVVLFVHGGFSPSTLAFDVPYRDYSWMDYLARAGYDVFAMDMTGYGRSGRPMMDDPCNLNPRQQPLLVPKNIPEPCSPKYPFELVSSDTETADIAVVDFIRKLRGVDKVTLIGWSGGGIRTGTYTVRNPAKVEKLIILASSNYNRKNPDNAPETMPKPGAPMSMQTRDVGINQRWLKNVKCDGQVEPGMSEYIWKLNIDHDSVGATWGSGGLRAPTRTYWGWNANSAKKINIPTLIMVGEEDDLLASNRDLHEDLGSQNKVLLAVSCATHFVVWEKQRRVLYRASLEWLQNTQLNGAANGQFWADPEGKISRRP
jgi:pimeloyl-ACP methyl ester carboxylesterase